jgi:hypothetical protein
MAVIDQCRSMIDQTLARTVEGLDSCCSSVFFGTNRMFRCCTAVQIASASFVSRACMLVGLNRSSLSYQPDRMIRLCASVCANSPYAHPTSTAVISSS